MELDEIEGILAKTLEDRRLSRGERRALSEVLADVHLDHRTRDFIRKRAFDLLRRELKERGSHEIMDWLEDVARVFARATDPERNLVVNEARFSPDQDCAGLIRAMLNAATKTVDICIFTITDDRIAQAIAAAHERGVLARIITDRDKSMDLGSDISELERQGIAVACDPSPNHMHHKFALFDRKQLLTGSYNWTRSASRDNFENVVVVNDPGLVEVFTREFERLWKKFCRESS